jgi:hypothetical protein
MQRSVQHYFYYQLYQLVKDWGPVAPLGLQNATVAPWPRGYQKLSKKIIELKISLGPAEVAVPAIFLYTDYWISFTSTDLER